MKSFTIALVLAVTLLAVALADPKPEPAKSDMRYRAAQIIEDGSDEGDMLDDVDDKQANVAINDSGNKKGDASSGRLFMKKFLLFKNMFGNNQKQPIIPIIITGGGTGTGTGTGTTPPTTTVTSTGTVPTATGTITTSPATPEPGDVTEGRRPAQRIQLVARGSYENNAPEEEEAEEEEEETAAVDNQALAAALAAGAQEYIVTDQDIKGTSDAKANRGPARVNLRRRGAKKGQVVSVRIPPKYRGYFQNGQRVILNTSNRPAKRRVVKKRVIRKRNKKNNNKRRRVVAQH